MQLAKLIFSPVHADIFYAALLCFAVHIPLFALLIPCVQIMQLVQASRSCSLRITTCVNTMDIHVDI